MNKQIATFAKNSRDQVRVSITEFQGYDLIDLRVWTTPENGGDQVATKRGLSIRVTMHHELIEALKLAEATAQKELLL